MSSLSPSWLIYLFGFVGIAAIGLIPFRSFGLLAQTFKDGFPKSMSRKLVATVAVLVVSACLYSDVVITSLIFKCLTDAYCGPNVSSGWIYLAMLGVMYLVFEVIGFVVRRVGRTQDQPA